MNNKKEVRMRGLASVKTMMFVALLAVAPLGALAQGNQLSFSDFVNEMVIVESGTFRMGATDGNGYDDERPVHEVTLTSFKISKYEVTQKLWNLVMDENPSTEKGDSLPVNNISWDECQTFIAKLNEKTGKTFRLPTEAEWEFAARGGIKGHDLGEGYGYQYAGGYDDVENMDAYVWYADNSDNTTHKIGMKKPNELGLFDMSGNVCEYVQDFFSWTSYTEDAQQDPKGVESGEARVFRGGSYERPAWQCRLASRFGIKPTERRTECGLRLAMDTSDKDFLWFLVTDRNIIIPMSQVGMLVAIDESKEFSVLDLNGNILAEDVLEVRFIQGEDVVTDIADIEEESSDALKDLVNNHLTLIGAKGLVELYAISGMKVRSVYATQQDTVIDVSDLSTGVYVVRCGKQSFKFYKK